MCACVCVLNTEEKKDTNQYTDIYSTFSMYLWMSVCISSFVIPEPNRRKSSSFFFAVDAEDMIIDLVLRYLNCLGMSHKTL